MRILYVSSYFPPEMGAPAARVHELSRAWVRAGHAVTVLTGFPNHPTGVIPEAYRGRLFDFERVDGIRLVRVPIYAASNKTIPGRIASYVSFAASAAAFGPVLTARPDVLIATSPQFLTAVVGYGLARLKHVPFVFEVRDLWPRSIVELGLMKADSVSVRALEVVEETLYRRAAKVVVVTAPFVDEIAGRGIPREKIAMIPNGVDLERFSPSPRDEARRALGLGDGFIATYIGTHGLAHGLDIVIDAAKLLAGTTIRFLLVGEGAEKASLKERAAREGVANLSMWDQVPRERVPLVLAASDVCLVLLRGLPIFRTVIPSKIFEVMGCARPIVTTVDGETRRIIEEARSGVFTPPDDAASLAATLRALSRDTSRLAVLGTNGRRYVEKNYSRDALAELYLEALREITLHRD